MTTNKQKKKLLQNLKPIEHSRYFILIKLEAYCQIQQIHKNKRVGKQTNKQHQQKTHTQKNPSTVGI